jgi:hypothetical protein
MISHKSIFFILFIHLGIYELLYDGAKEFLDLLGEIIELCILILDYSKLFSFYSIL